MKEKLPRIKAVAPADGAHTVRVTWSDGSASVINLSGWIATGGDILRPLADPAFFSRSKVVNYGAALAWDDADLSIDARHLQLLAKEQAPFRGSDAAEWQALCDLSNNEAADLLGISLSTWNDYKAKPEKELPAPVAIACRAAERDPLILQAHLRPRAAGRPRKAAGAA